MLNLWLGEGKKKHLQCELLSLSSQLSTLPRRAEVVLRPVDVSWRKYFPIISTTLSSSDEAGTRCPESRAVVYTILVPFREAPVYPPSGQCVFPPCIVLVEQRAARVGQRGGFIPAGCISWARARVGGANRFIRESSRLVSHATYRSVYSEAVRPRS